MRALYLTGAVLLTLVWLLARSFAPAGGLTRSYYYPLPRDANPPALDTRMLPTVVEEPAAGVDLAFLEELHRPVRDYFVRWRGVWFSPRQERIDFRAGADDGVIVRIDGEVVLERHPAVGMHTEMRSVALEAGAHTLEIDHWQRGAARYLNVQSAPAGGEPEPIRPGRLFPADPGALGYWLRVAAVQLAWPVLLVWAAGPATWLGRKVWRGAAALTAREVGARLWVVTLPAFLGPAQVLLFGPWTVHATNRAEFLAPFWSLAPRWIGLLGLVTGLLVAIGLLLPPRGFRPLRRRALRRRRTALGAGQPAGRRLRPAGRGRTRPDAARRARPVRGRPVDRRARPPASASPAPSAAPRPRRARSWWGCRPRSFSCRRSRRPRPGRSPAAHGGELAPAPGRDLRALRRPQPHPHRARHVPVAHLRRDPGRRPAGFDRGWSGFTFFREHLGAFRTTMGSMPAMLTGVPWRNEEPFGRYARRHPSVFHALGRHGYRLRSLTAHSPDHPSDRFPGAEGAVRYTIPSPYGSYRDYVDSASAQLLDLSLFRHAPHGVKVRIYRDDRWLFQQWIEARRGAVATAWRSFGDTVFLQEFASRITAAGDAPVYSFLHLITPHPPISTDAECVYPGRRPRLTRAGYLAQAQCALLAVRTLLDRLRDLGLYDRSAIIVTSDHGTSRFPAADHPFRRIGSPSGRTTLAVIGVRRHAAAPDQALRRAGCTIADVGRPDRGSPTCPPPCSTSPACRTPWRPERRPGARSGAAARADLRVSLLGRTEHPHEPLVRRAAPVLGGRAGDRPGGVALPEGNLRAGGRSRRPTRGASHRSLGGRGRGGAGRRIGRRTYVSGEYAAFFVPADTGRVTFDVRKAPALAAQTVTVRVDGRGRRPAVAHRRRVAHARLPRSRRAMRTTARSASSYWSARRGGRPTTTPAASCCGATSERRPARRPDDGGTHRHACRRALSD